MSDTPRVDTLLKAQFPYSMIDFARTLERELGEAKAKLSKLSRMIDISGQANDAASEAEVANSATFAEAMAHTNTEMVEAERDQWRAVAEQLAEELDFRFGQDPWRNPKSGAGMALAAYEKLKGTK